MQRHKPDWNHSSQEIESLTVNEPSANEWLKEVAWQLAKFRESLTLIKWEEHTRQKPRIKPADEQEQNK